MSSPQPVDSTLLQYSHVHTKKAANHQDHSKPGTFDYHCARATLCQRQLICPQPFARYLQPSSEHLRSDKACQSSSRSSKVRKRNEMISSQNHPRPSTRIIHLTTLNQSHRHISHHPVHHHLISHHLERKQAQSALPLREITHHLIMTGLQYPTMLFFHPHQH